MSNAKDTASLAEQAYRVLEKRLVMLDLPPGSQVSEGELIRLTGYGRTPVREAIQRLAQHELFRVIPRKGLMVSPVESERLLQILEARKPLESLIARQTAENANDKQRSSLAGLARELAGCHDNFGRLISIHSEIEALTNECCGNPYVIQAITPLRIHCRRFWNLHQDALKTSDIIVAQSNVVRLAARRDIRGAQKASDTVMQLMERIVSGLDDSA
jgi:DNA-binding GntR family transcriptional regulator